MCILCCYESPIFDHGLQGQMVIDAMKRSLEPRCDQIPWIIFVNRYDVGIGDDYSSKKQPSVIMIPTANVSTPVRSNASWPSHQSDSLRPSFPTFFPPNMECSFSLLSTHICQISQHFASIILAHKHDRSKAFVIIAISHERNNIYIDTTIAL
jgi:hypothetical protein